VARSGGSEHELRASFHFRVQYIKLKSKSSTSLPASSTMPSPLHPSLIPSLPPQQHDLPAKRVSGRRRTKASGRRGSSRHAKGPKRVGRWLLLLLGRRSKPRKAHGRSRVVMKKRGGGGEARLARGGDSKRKRQALASLIHAGLQQQ